MNMFKNKILIALLMCMAKSQANAISFSSLLSLFHAKKTVKTGISLNSKVILSVIGISAVTLIAYFWPNNKKQEQVENLKKIKENVLENNFTQVFAIRDSETNEAMILNLCEKKKSKEIFNILENNNVNINIYDHKSLETPLEIACKNGDISTIALLVHNNAIIRQKDIDLLKTDKNTTDNDVKNILSFIIKLELDNKKTLAKDVRFYIPFLPANLKTQKPSQIYLAYSQNIYSIDERNAAIKKLADNNAIIEDADIGYSFKKENHEIAKYLINAKENKEKEMNAAFEKYKDQITQKNA